MNPTNTSVIISRQKIILTFLTILLLSSQQVCFPQPVSLGWKGTELIPLNQFTTAGNWNPNFNHNTGDTCYVTTDDTCVYLHWKFGPGQRYKFTQIYQVVNPALSLSNKHIVGIDVKGSTCKSGRNVLIKFEDGTHQAYYSWDNLAGITRWCEHISVLEKEFVNTTQLRWDSVTVISLEVNSEASSFDTLPDSGMVAFRKLTVDSLASWTRATSFEAVQDSGLLSTVAQQALSAILNRQNQTTGLFYTWLTDKTSYLYGQGLVLKILSEEGEWKNGQAFNSSAKAAEKLALFLVKNQDKRGFWPRSWHTETGTILQNLENDGTVWMGDFPWIITGLQNYYNKSGDIRVKTALEKARFFLYNLIDDNGKFYTINPDTRQKYEVTSSEAYAAAILSVYEMGDSARAAKMQHYIDSLTWDPDLKYWHEATGSARKVLYANTWLAPFFKNSTDKQRSLDALSFVGKALFTRGPGAPYGLDGIGPVATWFEGTLSYICAGGPGSDSLFYNLIKYRYPDGTVPHYNDSVTAAGVWAVPWSSLDGTSWLYFAASKKSPFDRGTTLNLKDTEPKKVFIHTMGWYGSGSSGRHWTDGHAHTPLIGFYDSHSLSLELYQILLSWSCGIDGMIMNQKDAYDQQSVYSTLEVINRIRELDSADFNYDFAISYDDQGMDQTKPFDTAFATFDILKNYILPNTSNYMNYHDKPAVFVFNYPSEYLSASDYDSILNVEFGGNKPLLIWNQIEDTTIDYIDASYPWVGPDNTGWDTITCLNWGKNYLAWYYPQVNYQGMYLDFAIGGVWPGFDSVCTWCKNRCMDRQDGIVYDSTWSFINNYQQLLPLKWVVIETWNDWNEGTEIEPSKELGYKYLLATIKNINAFKGTNISEDTCKFWAAGEIYKAATLLEQSARDSTEYFPVLENAVKSFLTGDCPGAIQAAECIIDSGNYYRTDNITIHEGESYKGHTAAGTYTENLLSAGGCDSTVVTVLEVKPEAIVVTSSDKFTIYPNPSTGHLEITIDQPLEGDYKIEIFNDLGRKMQSVRQNARDKTIDLDITNYPAGIYMVKLFTGGKTYLSKVIKN